MNLSRGQEHGLIEHHLSQLPAGISEQKATDMQDIAHRVQRSVSVFKR